MRKNFTLIELLVVIAIIAILAGMLMPALSKARERGRDIASLSNCKQWSTANMMFVDDHQERLPWGGTDKVGDSYKVASGVAQGDIDEFWADMLPPYVGQAAFKDFATDTGKAQQKFLDNSIFCDPSAKAPSPADSTYDGSLRLYKSGSYYFSFAYVPNSKIDSKSGYVPYSGGDNRCKLSKITKSSYTVIFLEKRTSPAEISSSDTNYSKSLDRSRSDWQRVAARHNKGADLVFADGHAANTNYKYITTSVTTDSVNPDAGSGTYFNKSDLIWNPWGVAK